ncbi:MAG: hypothetical protein RLN62_06625, partial [Rickettsiales bacterium]
LQSKFDVLDKDKFVQVMILDKKNVKNQINLILIKDVGKCFLKTIGERANLEKFIRDFHV